MNKVLKACLISSVLIFLTTTLVYAQTSGNPKLEIITPSEGQTIYGSKIPVLFSVENFQLVDYQKNPNPQAGQGHIHLWLDEASPSKENATKVSEDNFTYSDVPYGNHTLIAELATNNHNSLTPPLKVTVNFTSSPISTPEAAASSGFDKKTAAVILVVVALVIVAAWWYTKEEDEEEMAVPKPKKTTKKKVQKSKK